MEYDDVRWLTSGNSCIGIVTKTDEITGEKFVYISSVSGLNEEKDILYILEWGNKLPASSLIELFS